MVRPILTPHEKAQRIATAVGWRGQEIAVHRDGLTLVLYEAPTFIRNKRDEIIGIDAWVKLFDGVREIPIDPHRIIVNPPTLPRANVTKHEDGTRIVGAPDPRAAYFEAVFDSVIGVPNAKGFRTRGTVTTVFGNEADNFVRSSNATYLTARSGSNLLTGAAGLNVGQAFFSPTYFIWESFIAFDTSSIGSDTISDATLSLDGRSDSSTTDFTVNARLKSWLASVTTADWVAGADLSALTLLAHFSSSGYSADYNAFTNDGLVANINTSGSTEMILCSARHEAGTVPTGEESLSFTDASTAGTTTDPKLDITHAAGGGGATHPGWQQRGGWW